MQGKLITIFGGGGFVGRYVAEALLARGARLRIAQRDPQGARHIKPLGNLGQVQLFPASVNHADSVKYALDGADMAINLVGSFDNMEKIQHEGAEIVAKAAKKAKLSAFLHMSAIGADSDSPSRYGRSKAAGEAAVQKAFKGATIIRPSIIFGREDQFINRFAAMIRSLPVIPVIGAETKFQPVFVGDVARLVTGCLADPQQHGGKIYEAGGPQKLSMLELNQWIANAIGQNPLFVETPNFAAKMLAMTTGWLPGAPITNDQLKMLAHDNVVTGIYGLDKCGIDATSIDSVAHDWLDIYRRHGRFSGEAKGTAKQS